jgi:ABC-2 type transport system permease protein
MKKKLRRAFRLISLYVQVSVANLAAYQFDMYMRVIVSMMHIGGELIIVWTIFHNVSSLKGWRWQHMLILVGIFRIIAGGIRMSIVPNMRKVLEGIRDGTLDFVLLRPVNSQFLVSIREFVVWRVIDLILGGIIVVIGVVKLTGVVPLKGVFMFVFMLAAAFMMVYAIWLALATLCFWFVRIQNIEMVFWNVFEAGRYPIAIYRSEVQWVLTFVIPLAFLTTFPVGAILADPSKMPPIMMLYATLIAAIMLAASSWFWRYGLRHYSGASA